MFLPVRKTPPTANLQTPKQSINFALVFVPNWLYAGAGSGNKVSVFVPQTGLILQADRFSQVSL